MKKMILTAAALAAVITASTAAKADPAVGIAVVAPLTPATAGIAAGVAVVAHEAFAKKPFGPHGEVVKAGKSVGDGVHNFFHHL